MKIRTISLATFVSFLRNRIILLFCFLFACVVLLMMSPLMAYKTMTTASNAEQMQGLVLNIVASIMSLVSGFGSLLAAWAAADSIASEMKSGTVLAVLARPLHRWEFLVGKYLAVLMLMGIYVLGMLFLTFFLAWLGGQHFQTSLWTLLVYPLVRYAIWAAISMFFVTLLHPVVVLGIVIVLATIIQYFSSPHNSIPVWLQTPLHVMLPMTSLLSEQRFLSITRAIVKPFPWTNHLTALAYGLDYALGWFLLAIFIFQYRNLSRD